MAIAGEKEDILHILIYVGKRTSGSIRTLVVLAEKYVIESVKRKQGILSIFKTHL